MYQKLIYPMKFINITQGSNGEFSHKNVYAIDLAGQDYNAEDVFAQGNGIVQEITDRSVTIRYDKVIGQSGQKYEYSDVLYFHQTANQNIKVGQKIKKGQIFMKEGMKGHATGNHIHVEIKCFNKGLLSPLMPERMFFVDPKFNRQLKNKSEEAIRIV